MSIIEEYPTYYDDIRSYLISERLAKEENNKINWSKIEYPPTVYSANDSKKIRNKKTERFREKCKHYKLDEKNNVLYVIK